MIGARRVGIIMRASAVVCLVLATCAAAGWFVRRDWLEISPPRLRGSTVAHTLVGAAAHEAQTPELAAAAVRRSLQAAAQRTTWRPLSLQAAAQPATWPPPPPQLAATVAASTAASVLPTLPLRLHKQAAAGSFGGNQTADDRTRLHAGCLGETKCGYLAPSGFDRLREEVRRHEVAQPCPIVVLTAIFGCKDKLQQPEAPPPQLHSCFFAFVDEQSARYLRATVRPRLPPPATHAPTRLSSAATHAPTRLLGWQAPRHVEVSEGRVGQWQLLTLTPPLAYASARRNSRVPKLLPFRLFRTANYSLWIDGKLRLRVDPMRLVHRYLHAPNAVIAAARNLRRDHIDEERAWIRRSLCDDARKVTSTTSCAEVEDQWRFYQAEQSELQTPPPRQHALPAPAAASAEGGAAGGAAAWVASTTCAEGAMLLVRLRSPAAQCLLCAWFGEWDRFAERDQLALSYVLHAMRVHRTDRDSDGVHLWPRSEHWNAKPRRGEAKPWRYVAYRGHSGTESGACDDHSRTLPARVLASPRTANSRTTGPR